MSIRNLVILCFLGITPALSWDLYTVGAAWEPHFQDQKPSPEFGVKGSYKQEYALGFHIAEWNRLRRDLPLYYGLKQAFRVTPAGVEVIAQAQGSVLLKAWVIGVGAGPVFRFADENSVDIETSIWTGSFLLLNVRFPAIVNFPGNTTSNFPRFGMALVLPIGDFSY